MPQPGGQAGRSIAMSEVTTYGWTIDQDLTGYARHGYKGMEVWLNKVARTERLTTNCPQVYFRLRSYESWYGA